jgi:hypothetical protein
MWLPVSTEEDEFDASKLSSPPRIRQVVEFKDVTINQEVPDRVFSLAYLACRNGTPVNSIAPDGTVTHSFILDDDSAPAAVVARVLDQRRTIQSAAATHRRMVFRVTAIALGVGAILAVAVWSMRHQQRSAGKGLKRSME